MKKLHLENFGVQEMNAREMKNENGGSAIGDFFVKTILAPAYALSSSLEFGVGFAQGLAGGFHDKYD
ncbi:MULTISPECIES: hypothetical protein [unclassified Pedobacter]|uniref:hypothetical protein n=1 Tax=unclassified Pedobacter TaxID=2628915 RepID=UPI000B4BF027|nr:MULTISPECIES: hypothetical protein [unclassified Pedobacter]MCX2432652.1 hypothetical protein [Pedobacter sp. GR22-10]OWK70107.1 hypothetical protein CBW18_14100 [Pedobacter sp. AJM]